MTVYDKAEGRLVISPKGLSATVGRDCSPLVEEKMDQLYELANTFCKHQDLFSESNDPVYGAEILVRQCNDLLEVTPVYERDLPNHPPFSASELLVGRVLTQYQEGAFRG